MGALGDMINSGAIDIKQFFTMHPFSATDRMYSKALQGIDFYEDLYMQTGKTYERLATICNVVNNAGMNLVVVTGYRGCGKTNFLQFVHYIAEGKVVLKPISALRDLELKYAKDSEQMREIRSRYDESLKRIKETLYMDFFEKDDDYIDKNFGEYISKCLHSSCEYINFDTGGMAKESPLESKLLIEIREVADRIIKDNRIDQVLSLIRGFASRNKWIIEEGFESIKYSTLKELWRKVRDEIPTIPREKIDDYLQDNLCSLSLEQLLFAYTLLNYAEIVTNNFGRSEHRLLYILDNIDMIADGATNIFTNTMMGVWKFIWDTRTIFERLDASENEDDKKFLELYNKTNFIVAMRETTAMHITDHLRDRMGAIMKHFDISSDVDKTAVMQRKIDLAFEMINDGQIVNIAFKDAITLVNELIQDRVLIRNLFLLYNNDYRTSMAACTWLCIKYRDEVLRAITLIQTGESSLVFGGRGIIYRLLFDAFTDWTYLDKIGITTRNGAAKPRVVKTQYDYSCARIILTILCNKQAKNSDRFFVRPEESVRLIDLHALVDKIIDSDDLINIIDGMYSLRDQEYWNHLVTFDNILKYNRTAINKSLTKTPDEKDESPDVYIRATSAGQAFADYVCVHFEYFASRFSSANYRMPLFLIPITDKKRYISVLSKTVSDIYEAVAKCCETLEDYNRVVLQVLKKGKYNDILESPYYFEKQFHEERIIHHHISYLEAYRRYLLKVMAEGPTKIEANQFIISMIKKYLDLLKYNPNDGFKGYRDLFYTPNSCSLYNELSVCIEHIEQNGIEAANIEITREYYMQHYRSEVCSFIKKWRKQ